MKKTIGKYSNVAIGCLISVFLVVSFASPYRDTWLYFLIAN